MTAGPQDIGPRWGPRTEERRYVGPAGWSLPRRARELAAIEKVDVMTVSREPRRWGTRERVVVRVIGTPPALDRYWRRLDEIDDAVNAASGTHAWWLRNAMRFVINVWRS